MQVTIHALFSKNKKIGSKVICKGSKHLTPNLPEMSHSALLINNRWVHESTGHSGVRVISYDKWLEINTEVARIKLENKEYQEIADDYRKIQNKDYDYFGVFYLAICIIPTFFGFKLPKKNKWESSNKYFCCEVLGYLTGHYYGMCSPNLILEKLSHG